MKSIPIIKRPLNGLYISIEGLDGSGKSTLINKIIQFFNSMNNGIYRDKISNNSFKFDVLCKNFYRNNKEAAPISIALNKISNILFLNETEISSDLKDGKIVITDRNIDSPILYHTILYIREDFDENYATELYSKILRLIKTITYLPDKTFILDLDFDICKRRIEERDKMSLSQEKITFLKRVHSSFQNIKDKDRFVRIKEFNEIINFILNYLKIPNAKEKITKVLYQ